MHAALGSKHWWINLDAKRNKRPANHGVETRGNTAVISGSLYRADLPHTLGFKTDHPGILYGKGSLGVGDVPGRGLTDNLWLKFPSNRRWGKTHHVTLAGVSS